MSTPEGKVKALVKRELDTLPKVYRHMPVMNGMGAPALDFNVCVSGFWVSIETKALGKTLTERQKKTAADIHASGGRVYVIDGPETCAAMMGALRRLCQL
jgi:hypothetical protein